MDKVVISYINPYVGYAGKICAEKDEMPDIGASCLLRCVVLFVCHSWQFNPCLSENILDESGTVKPVRGSPAEYIWNSL